jgi:hypothetical protein
MLAATAPGLAAVGEGSRVGSSAASVVVKVVEVAAVRSLRGTEAEDLAAGAVVLVDAVESCSRQCSNRWLPLFSKQIVDQ